ncbi:DUF1330 domain-containing protein [Sandaracinobacter neustonicus]|uniref:DUF1330 domain-containing protein n=1 Tax=Sandaracinobacter neustonicus TaxID=1715348 RepID=A0A501XKN5_9SPHN|nr:DUF1330 domain-containing protein [Sandaracinobacter neustonicus]TPE60989.1 DUF1330 domain-containing protein [Sandaracinobacter neustonicus]
MTAKGYVIARVSVQDSDAYAHYAQLARLAMERHGARILARGGRYHELEGAARPRNVILEFDSYDAALRYWQSPEYQDARRHRLHAAEIELCVVEGVDEPVGDR